MYICVCVYVCVGRDNAVSSDSLLGGRSGDRILVGARFSAPLQTGPGSNPAFYKMGTGSFPWVNWPLRGVNHPPPSSTEVKERVDLLPLWAFVDSSGVNINYIYIYIYMYMYMYTH